MGEIIIYNGRQKACLLSHFEPLCLYEYEIQSPRGPSQLNQLSPFYLRDKIVRQQRIIERPLKQSRFSANKFEHMPASLV